MHKPLAEILMHDVQMAVDNPLRKRRLAGITEKFTRIYTPHFNSQNLLNLYKYAPESLSTFEVRGHL
jgi:hypothetical protein